MKSMFANALIADNQTMSIYGYTFPIKLIILWLLFSWLSFLIWICIKLVSEELVLHRGRSKMPSEDNKKLWITPQMMMMMMMMTHHGWRRWGPNWTSGVEEPTPAGHAPSSRSNRASVDATEMPILLLSSPLVLITMIHMTLILKLWKTTSGCACAACFSGSGEGLLQLSCWTSACWRWSPWTPRCVAVTLNLYP